MGSRVKVEELDTMWRSRAGWSSRIPCGQQSGGRGARYHVEEHIGAGEAGYQVEKQSGGGGVVSFFNVFLPLWILNEHFENCTFV